MNQVVRQKGVPGINMAALNAIQDENTRLVLQSIVDGLNVRNGVAGKGDAAFITRAELGGVRNEYTGLINNLLALVRQNGGPLVDPAQISRIINDLQGQIMASPLWVDLGTTLEGINTDLAQEILDRVADVQAEAEARLNQDDVLGGDITTLQSVTADHAEEITGILTRVDGAESSIITLNSTTATHATSLTSLTSRMGTAESNVSTLFTTTAGHASSISTISSTLTTAQAAIVAEATARANADNAITSSVTTQFATVNGTIAGISSTLTATATQSAANASSITTINSTVGSLSATVSTNHSTMTSLTGTINAKITNKIDVNGYVTGYGLIADANTATPTSEFIVRADRFSIGTATGPSITPRIPFIVLTSTDGAGNPPGVYMDLAVIKQASITNAYITDATITTAKIGDAQVDTLKIAGNAVTIPAAVQPAGTVTITSFNTWYEIGSISVDFGSNVPGNVLIFATSNFTYSSGSGETIYEFRILHNGAVRGTVSQSAPSGYAFSASGATTGGSSTTGSNTFTMEARRVSGGTIHYASGRALAVWGIRR